MHLTRRDFLKASAAASDGPGLQAVRMQRVKCRPAPFMGRTELPSKSLTAVPSPRQFIGDPAQKTNWILK